jgi:hypothetical protein
MFVLAVARRGTLRVGGVIRMRATRDVEDRAGGGHCQAGPDRSPNLQQNRDQKNWDGRPDSSPQVTASPVHVLILPASRALSAFRQLKELLNSSYLSQPCPANLLLAAPSKWLGL